MPKLTVSRELEVYRRAQDKLDPIDRDIIYKQIKSLGISIPARGNTAYSGMGQAACLELMAKLAMFCYQNDIGVKESEDE